MRRLKEIMNRINPKALLFLFFAGFASCSLLRADTRPILSPRVSNPVNSGESQLDSDIVPEVETSTSAKKGAEFLLAPIPFSNPSLGSGITAMSSLIYRIDENDQETAPSMTGV